MRALAVRTSEHGVPGWLYAPRDLPPPPPRGLRPPSSPRLAQLRLPDMARGADAYSRQYKHSEVRGQTKDTSRIFCNMLQAGCQNSS